MKTFDEVKEALTGFGMGDFETPTEEQVKRFDSEFLPLLSDKSLSKRVVVGIDIYKYSEFDEAAQPLVPFIFDFLRDITLSGCTFEKMIFPTSAKETLKKEFISTGDGGFQFLDDPLQAIVYISFFQSNLLVYNSSKVLPHLRAKTGPISLRYAITLADVFQYNANYYGKAIIDNARMLSRDHLNRCLIDESTKNWFEQEINGVESLEVLNLSELKKIQWFGKARNHFAQDSLNLMFSVAESKFNSVNCAYIGEIRVKSSELRVYNLYWKVNLTLHRMQNDQFGKLSIAVGNINSNGIQQISDD